MAQLTLTDAASLSWDISLNDTALLTATVGVGNVRTLPNTILTNGVNGQNYQLTFIQDSIGNREISFESDYSVIGKFNKAANARTIITFIVQGSKADVVLSSLIDEKIEVSDLADGTDGELITWDAAGVPATVPVGTATYVLTSNGVGTTPTFQAPGGGGALVRAGGNLTEATTTSTSAVDLLTSSALSIAVDLPIQVLVSGRKTSGATSSAGLGLKLNTTVVGEAHPTATTSVLQLGSVNAAISKSGTMWIPQRVTLYSGQGSILGLATGLGISAAAVGTTPSKDTALPLAVITSIVIRGISTSGVTLGADELNIYTYSTT